MCGWDKTWSISDVYRNDRQVHVFNRGDGCCVVWCVYLRACVCVCVCGYERACVHAMTVQTTCNMLAKTQHRCLSNKASEGSGIISHLNASFVVDRGIGEWNDLWRVKLPKLHACGEESANCLIDERQK